MWRGEHGPQAFQAPVDVHASADGQVYMFRRRPNELALSSDDEELSVLETRQMNQDKLRNVQLLERKVLDGDNLNKLALQYGCKVADLKQINNLIQDQDLFALKYVKIPIQKHSLLRETFSDLRDPQEDKPGSPLSPGRPHDRARGQPHLQEVTDFLMEVDSEIDKLILTSEHDEAFLKNSEKPQRFGFRQWRPKGNGADWGIQWWNAVVAMLLIGIVLPIFYIIYFKTKNNGVVVSPTDANGPSSSIPPSNAPRSES